MKYVFKSNFADRLNNFITQKNSLGYPYLESSRILMKFDEFCLEQFPKETSLTKEIFLLWAVKKDSECNNTFRNRIFPVREFSKYLNRCGEKAYLLPINLIKKGTPNAPHIYTESEIMSIWNVLDSFPFKKRCPVRHLALSASIKLLYCCGLRPSESLKLRVENVNLQKGRIDIIESKAHKSRIIMMTDDVNEMLYNYNKSVSAIMPERTIFFPSSQDSVYTRRWMEENFKNILKKADVKKAGKVSPRLYDFRHTFATHRLYYWMREGKDLSAMIPYLSAYMGHEQLSDTYYYIHLVPGLFEEITGFDDSFAESLIPEVEDDE